MNGKWISFFFFPSHGRPEVLVLIKEAGLREKTHFSLWATSTWSGARFSSCVKAFKRGKRFSTQSLPWVGEECALMCEFAPEEGFLLFFYTMYSWRICIQRTRPPPAVPQFNWVKLKARRTPLHIGASAKKTWWTLKLRKTWLAFKWSFPG